MNFKLQFKQDAKAPCTQNRTHRAFSINAVKRQKHSGFVYILYNSSRSQQQHQSNYILLTIYFGITV